MFVFAAELSEFERRLGLKTRPENKRIAGTPKGVRGWKIAAVVVCGVSLACIAASIVLLYVESKDQAFAVCPVLASPKPSEESALLELVS